VVSGEGKVGKHCPGKLDVSKLVVIGFFAGPVYTTYGHKVLRLSLPIDTGFVHEMTKHPNVVFVKKYQFSIIITTSINLRLEEVLTKLLFLLDVSVLTKWSCKELQSNKVWQESNICKKCKSV
jgi:hypothetical protein